jgi:hypothetical protein
MPDNFYFQEIQQHIFNKSAEAKVDRFAFGLCGPNGTYIEIGSQKPVQRSNTVSLERLGWKGFGLELDIRHQIHWPAGRKNPIYWEDATTFDYWKAAKDQGLPERINFLQADIEPPENTFIALKKAIESGLTFDYIAFEHDVYCQEIDYNVIATDYLLTKGYKVAVYNVCSQRKRNPGVWSHIETWYVKDDIPFDTMEFFEWKRKYNIK